MTPEEIQQCLHEIKDDPKLLLLSQAIIDLSASAEQCMHALVTMSNRVDLLSKAVSSTNESLNVIISQMWILSQKPGFPLAFRGGLIK